MPKIKKFDREKVLAEAAEIFRTNGYNGTSIDDILKATGLSRSSLYDSFTDKHSLYLQALEHYKNREAEGYGSINKIELNGYQKIERLFQQVVKYLSENPDDNGCLIVNAAAEMSKRCEKTNQVVCNNKESVQELFSHWLDDAQKMRQVNLSKPPSDYSPFLFNALCGLKVLSQSGATREELDNVVKVTLEALS
jgi:TetR/AcrR family transcriptional regulator, transcriptional repressor for nem operon